MTFDVGKIYYFVLSRSFGRNWQLAADRFLPKESHTFQNTVTNNSQLVTGFQASRSRCFGTKSELQNFNSLQKRMFLYPHESF